MIRSIIHVAVALAAGALFSVVAQSVADAVSSPVRGVATAVALTAWGLTFGIAMTTVGALVWRKLAPGRPEPVRRAPVAPGPGRRRAVPDTMPRRAPSAAPWPHHGVDTGESAGAALPAEAPAGLYGDDPYLLPRAAADVAPGELLWYAQAES